MVAATVATCVIGGYYAFKGQIDSFKLLLSTFNGRLDAHATRLRAHGADLRDHGRKLAAVEGKVFNRRVEDRTAAPDPNDDNEEEI